MRNEENNSKTGFRFPCNLCSRIYAVDPENSRAVIVKYLGGNSLELGILHEDDYGRLKMIVKTTTSCTLDENGYLIALDENSIKSVSCGSLCASISVNSEGFVELMITHRENGELITERFTS